MEGLQDDDPQQVGRYTLLGRLGSGGMGEVFLGRSPGGRLVAVKVIRPALAQDRSFRARFAREVAAARMVSGVFTAPVIDADPEARLPWLVTGYVNGPSLASAVEEHGPLPLPALLSLAAGLAEGLGAVHDAGIIHRDLKPSNVLLAQDGPRLIDFGISQAAEFSHVTLTGMVVGTPGFMSPEQAIGDSVGPPSDIFSLGAVLAFAATGKGPYGTGSPAAHQFRVVSLTPRLDDVPAEFRPLVERCMAREPADRPTAGQFLADLVAAHPAAADQTDWLPLGIAPEGGSPTKPAPASLDRETPARAPGWELTVTAFASDQEKAVTPRPDSADPPPQPREQPRQPWEQPRQQPWERSRQPEEERLFYVGQPVLEEFPPVPDTRPRKRGRRRWVIAAATAAVVGTVIGLVAAMTSSPQLLQPTGLMASDLKAQSVEIAWSGPANGPLPDQYEVEQDGQEVASVPGTKTAYSATGLSPRTAYQFSVVAVRGTSHSSASSTLTVTTPNPALADAVLRWSGQVGFTEAVYQATPSSSTPWPKAGPTWQDPWTFTPTCASGPCDVELNGSISGKVFSARLSRNGATYSGSVAINDYWSCVSKSNYTQSTLHILVTGNHAVTSSGVWAVNAFTGTATWNVDFNPSGRCDASTYNMQLHSV